MFKLNRTVNVSNEKSKITKLRQLAQVSQSEVLQTFSSNLQGLSSVEAKHRQDQFGLNVTGTGKQHTAFSRFIEALINPFNLILLLIAGVTFVTDVLLTPTGSKDYATVIIILLMVFLSTLMGYLQSRNSDQATDNLKNLIANTCHLYRDGQLVEVNMEDLVVGDIVSLSSGDMFPADLRFLQTKDLFVSQSALTGESEPVEKFADQDEEAPTKSISDLANIGLLGADVVSGKALAIVVATGQDTYFSSIADAAHLTGGQSSFDRGMANISKLLIRMMLLVVPFIFLINGWAKGDWLQALLFTVSIAVGLTPELLPVIMTTTLSQGALKMSEQKVIVRDLGAIQTFGEMDILCTDKTGTLTEDKITVEKYMDLHGNDDQRVLRHAYLNSSFQTGLKNLIDLAIISRAEKYGLDRIKDNYFVNDEIPFDFNRRRMSVVIEDQAGKRQLITKGAVEEMLEICAFAEIEGQVIELGEREREIALATYNRYNAEGLRMIAVAQKNHVPDENKFSVQDESDMVLIGFVGFLDPPKASAQAAIETLANHGVRTVVLTGDSQGVAKNVLAKVGIDTRESYLGTDVEEMTDAQLQLACQKANLFSKLSPMQKARVIGAFQSLGHTVGYMGDGINDTPGLRAADIGISVDGAVDIAKETSNIVLLEKDLMVLERGIQVGRKTFGNMMKYLNLAVSGNFANIISVIAASLFLPFLPMLPVQLLAQNLLNDFAQMGIAFDNVDPDYINEPKAWDVQNVKRFMLVFGPAGALLDLALFAVLWFVFDFNSPASQAFFHVSWFLYGTLSQIVAIFILRSKEIPALKSKASNTLYLAAGLVSMLVLIIVFSPIAHSLDMGSLPLRVFPVILLLVLAYAMVLEVCKYFYIKKFKTWI